MPYDAHPDVAAESGLDRTVPPENLPPMAPYRNHGKTVAGWALFWALVVASSVIALGFVIPSKTVIIIGGVLVVVGLILGQTLRAMGMGQPRTSESRHEAAH